MENSRAHQDACFSLEAWQHIERSQLPSPCEQACMSANMWPRRFMHGAPVAVSKAAPTAAAAAAVAAAKAVAATAKPAGADGFCQGGWSFNNQKEMKLPRGCDKTTLCARLSWMIAAGLLLFIIIDASGALKPSSEVGLGMSDVADEILGLASGDAISDAHLGRILSQVEESTGSSSAKSNSQETHGSGDHGHAAHPHDAMLFLFNAIILGTAVSHVLTFDLFHHLEYSHTVVLYLLGLGYSLVMEGLNADEKLGVLGRSYNMWMQIDPQLLLFTMLPALLTAQTMNIDTDVVKRCANQCVYLAGPGVVINGFLTALGLHLYLGWDFKLSLTTGAILCATDPVAVVALLKDLNACPSLVVQLQGESLLNNGTAMVFYTICYNLLKGEPYDLGGIVTATVWKVIVAWGMGAVIGYMFNLWIRASNNKLEHTSGLVQISLTISSAYGAFYLAEGMLGMSGVIATVACAHVLAKSTWMVMVSREAVKTVWEMLEYFGHTLVFFLAGALTGKTMLHIAWGDYLHLVVLYVMLNVIRFLMILLSRPVLKMQSKEYGDIPIGNAIVLSWSGVRGAVSLTLGMQVLMDRAGGAIEEMEAHRVLFFVSGIAMLTIIVNAQTCPRLVRWFGIANLPVAKLRMMEILFHRMEQLMQLKDGKKSDDKEKTDVIKKRLSQLEEDQPHEAPRLTRSSTCGDQRPSQGLRRSTTQRSNFTRSRSTFFEIGYQDMQSTEDLVKTNKRFRDWHAKQSASKLGDLPKVADIPFASEYDNMVKIMTTASPDIKMMRAMHEAFLNLLKRRYWLMIEAGDVVPGTNEAEVLLASTKLAFGVSSSKLGDFTFIKPYCERSELPPAYQRTSVMPVQRGNQDDGTGELSSKQQDLPDMDALEELMGKEQGCAQQIVESSRFDCVMMLIIFINAILMAVEESQDASGGKSHTGSSLGWLIVDMIFTVGFTVEFALKLWVLRLSYFYTGWNVFDALLVLMGWVGTCLQFLALESPGGAQNVTREGRLFSVARSFRVLRVLRVFRLLFIFQVLKAKMAGKSISLALAEHMQKMTILKCAVKAHLVVQVEIAKFFGTEGQPDSFEIIYAILQSQCTIYEAMQMALEEEQQLGAKLSLEVKNVQATKTIAERLEVWVCDAHSQGILNSHEAESILAPLREHMKAWTARLRANHFGFAQTRNSPAEEGFLLGLDDEPKRSRVLRSTFSPDEEMSGAGNSETLGATWSRQFSADSENGLSSKQEASGGDNAREDVELEPVMEFQHIDEPDSPKTFQAWNSNKDKDTPAQDPPLLGEVQGRQDRNDFTITDLENFDDRVVYESTTTQ